MRIGFSLAAHLAMLLMSLTAPTANPVAQPLFQPWVGQARGGLPPIIGVVPRSPHASPSQRNRPQQVLRQVPTAVPRQGLPPHLQRQLVEYQTTEPADTIIIDTVNT